MDQNTPADEAHMYPLTCMGDLIAYFHESGESFWGYVESCEGEEIWDFLSTVWDTMKSALKRGLDRERLRPHPPAVPAECCRRFCLFFPPL